MKYEIDHETVQALMRYLVTRPFQEVEQGIAMLRSLKRIEKKKEGEGDDGK